MKAPIPDNEKQRLAALREYQILDSGTEQAYDDITALAAYVCDVPIATISLVDESRQWFKSRVGLNEQETPRDVAFCAHAILQVEPLIVRDALNDARFADSALVTRTPHIRFYAGFPLSSPEGFALGSLCAIDRKPRQLSPQQKTAMQALARQVMALLELRRASKRMAEVLEKVKTLHGLLPICAWCKRIRDDQGYWSQVEAYIHEHTGADFTHGICPECLEKQRPNRGTTE
ncbi:MAG TPA: GAF domain-containing protein [Candidatus Paceibacterota bacterium]|nr:GAF domain-containing protein [Verrucomicrobiota bacterium]HSA11696.1 GAF domain-containing protein [Candidatus Paceibacterota bacterium]